MTLLNQLKNTIIKPADYQALGQQRSSPVFKITIVHCLLGILALLCLIFILFITLARSIEIRTYTVDVADVDSAELYRWLAGLRDPDRRGGCPTGAHAVSTP